MATRFQLLDMQTEKMCLKSQVVSIATADMYQGFEACRTSQFNGHRRITHPQTGPGPISDVDGGDPEVASSRACLIFVRSRSAGGLSSTLVTNRPVAKP